MVKATKQQGSDERTVKLDDAPALDSAEEQAHEVVARNADEELSGKKVRVTFQEQEGEGGADAIFASLNGYAYQIPRGVPVEIPVELLGVFEDAKTRMLTTRQGGGVQERSVNRFNYTVHGAV